MNWIKCGLCNSYRPTFDSDEERIESHCEKRKCPRKYSDRACQEFEGQIPKHSGMTKIPSKCIKHKPGGKI